MLDTSNFERRHYIGQLDMDFEPGVFPSKWDLRDMPLPAQDLSNWIQIEPVGTVFPAAGSVAVEQPVSQLVDFYDRIIKPAYWNRCVY